MLLLERKLSQRVFLTGGIVVTICAIDGHKQRVKLGFEAPDNISIVREEVLLRDQENADQSTI